MKMTIYKPVLLPATIKEFEKQYPDLAREFHRQSLKYGVTYKDFRKTYTVGEKAVSKKLKKK
jgi:hypothetical protein